MKAEKLIIAIGLIALIIVLAFIPFNSTREIVINSKLYDVVKQINDLNNWKKWNQDLGNSNIKISGDYITNQTATLSTNQYYLLHHVNPLTISFIKNSANASMASIIAISSSTNDSLTHISWTEHVTAFEILEQSFIKNDLRQSSLNNLKKLMEDVNYKYGFFIHIVPVKDTLILTAEMPFSDSINTMTNMYQRLELFIKQNNLPAETKYFYKTQLSDNKIAVGIPVYKPAANDNNIKFLELPGNGRLVEGTYKGKLADKQTIYTAINNFMFDQHLKQVAQPFEQYNVTDINVNADSNINIKVYYPVF